MTWISFSQPSQDTVRRLPQWVDDAVTDSRYALRQMRRAPSFAALIIVTLAIGIGANVTMAGAIDRLLLRPPAHVRDPDHVARLLHVKAKAAGGGFVGSRWNYPQMLDLEQEVSSFSVVAAFTTVTLSLGRGMEATSIRASLVSPGYFPLLGATPVLGRMFTPRDGFPRGESSGGPPLAVLSYGFWQRQFGADRDIIGRPVRIGSLTYTIVGVTPDGFRGTEAEAPDVWLPLTVAAEQEGTKLFLADRSSTWLSIIARLRAGATREGAEHQALEVWRRYLDPRSDFASSGHVAAASLIQGRGPDAPREVRLALWLGGVSAVVLLIACANVANLLLARAFTRRREVAVRLALGASRARLARQVLVEALLLAAIGAAAAVYLAYLGGDALRHLLGSDLGGGSFVDGRLFAFAASLALGTAVLVSLAPLTQSLARGLPGTLATGAAAGGGRTTHARAGLLAVQAGLCTVLLVGAGLFALSLQRVEALDLGLDVDHTLMAVFDLRFDGDATRSEVDTTYSALLDRVRALPGVTHVALAEYDPFGGGRAVAVHPTGTDQDTYWHEGVMEVPRETPVGSDFFHAIGTTSLRGRDFDARDSRGAPRVAIINEPLVRILFPQGDALGQCVVLPRRSDDRGGDCVTVVGVLQGFWRRSILNRESLVVYIPVAQRVAGPGLGRPQVLVVGTRGDPSFLAPTLRRAIQSMRSDQRAVRVIPMRDRIDPELRPWRLAAGLFALFGGVALAIAVVGLYGVVAFTAAQRSTEIAVRIALGANARDILGVVGRDSLYAVGAGVAAGAVIALVASRWIGPLLFQTSPRDPGIIALVAGLLFVIAQLAILGPTLRAMRRGPAVILRASRRGRGRAGVGSHPCTCELRGSVSTSKHESPSTAR